MDHKEMAPGVVSTEGRNSKDNKGHSVFVRVVLSNPPSRQPPKWNPPKPLTVEDCRQFHIWQADRMRIDAEWDALGLWGKGSRPHQNINYLELVRSPEKLRRHNALMRRQYREQWNARPDVVAFKAWLKKRQNIELHDPFEDKE